MTSRERLLKRCLTIAKTCALIRVRNCLRTKRKPVHWRPRCLYSSRTEKSGGFLHCPDYLLRNTQRPQRAGARVVSHQRATSASSAGRTEVVQRTRVRLMHNTLILALNQ